MRVLKKVRHSESPKKDRTVYKETGHRVVRERLITGSEGGTTTNYTMALAKCSNHCQLQWEAVLQNLPLPQVQEAAR